MKKPVFKYFLVLSVFTIIQPSCKLGSKGTDKSTLYARGKELEDMANTMVDKQNTDSAIIYLNECIPIYKELINTDDRQNHTVYIERLLKIHGELGGLYFGNQDFKTAITHFSEALKLADKSNSMDREFENEMIGHSLLELGHVQSDPDQMQNYTLKGISYVNQACNIIDSSGMDTVSFPDFTGVFNLAVNINARWGDTAKAEYFNTRYLAIKYKKAQK